MYHNKHLFSSSQKEITAKTLVREGFILKKIKNDGIFHVGGGVFAIPSWNYFFFVWVLNHPEMQ